MTRRRTKRSSVTLRFLSRPKTIAAENALKAQFTNPHTDRRVLDFWDRIIESLRKAGMPEE